MADFGSVATASTENTTTLTVTKPTGLASGDLMVFFGLNTTAGSGGAAYTRSGWTQIVSASDSGSIEAYLTVLAKVADSSDAAASNFAFSNADDHTHSGILYRITGTFSGVGNIVASIAGEGTEQTDDDPQFPTGIIPLPNSLLIMYAGGRVSNSATSSLSGYSIATSDPAWTERADFAVSTDEDQRVGSATATRTEATATGVYSVDFNSTGNLIDGSARGALISIVDSANISITGSTGVINLQGIEGSVSAGASVTGTTGVINIVGNEGAVATPNPDWINVDKSATPSWVNPDKS